MKALFKILTISSLLASPLAFAVDTDGDGSPDSEEAFAGTNPNDPLERPWWWKRVENSFFSSGLGDVNGDDIPDFAVGKPDIDFTATNAGILEIYSGATGLRLSTLHGQIANASLGTAMAPAGDQNQDGFDDFWVSAPFETVTGYDKGVVRLISGQDNSELYAVPGTPSRVLTNVGDINKDGFDDFASGSYQAQANQGEVKVYSGTDGSLIYTFYGTGDNFAATLAGGGDANNDGYPDILISAYDESTGFSQNGTVYLYSGKDGSLLQAIHGSKDQDKLGLSVSWLGDVDQDGSDDFISGAQSGQNKSGRAHLFSGLTGQEILNVSDATLGSAFGWQVIAAGDVNQDGIPDFAASAPSIGGNPSYGRVFVFSAADGSVLYRLSGLNNTDSLGQRLVSLNDLDGDNLPELLIINQYSQQKMYISLSKDLANDSDGDFKLNLIDGDFDNDGVDDIYDLYPNNPNAAGDFDNDGIDSLQDNCSGVANPVQQDIDSDGEGDACDDDIDGDSYLNDLDTFPNDPAEWLDSDGDSVGDNADAFPNDPNVSIDTDGDGIDDILDEDDDGDGLSDLKEVSLGLNSKLADTNGDGAPDGYEPLPPRSWSPDYYFRPLPLDEDSFFKCEKVFTNLPEFIIEGETLNFTLDIANNDQDCQLNIESYATLTQIAGNAYGPYTTAEDAQIATKIDCSIRVTTLGALLYCDEYDYISIPVIQLVHMDTDMDGIIDFNDDYPTDPNKIGDPDADSIDSLIDNCPNTANPGQSDNDNDGIGNACDSDIDGDDIDNALDTHPLNPIYFTDFDGDKLNAFEDNCPFVSNAGQSDSDNDGDGNACDDDLDGDGFNDALDSHPLNASLFTDFDRDAVNSHQDNCPFNKNPGQSDNDGDGLGNACDPDVDGDGVYDVSDNYPRNPNLW